MSTYQSASNNNGQERRNLPLLIGGFALLLAALILVVVWRPLATSAAPEAAAVATGGRAGGVDLPTGGPPLQPSATIYDFNLPTVSGAPERIHLQERIGSPLILNFWASWCGPCRLEAPNLKAADQQYGADGLVIIGINQDEPVGAAQGFIDEFDWQFPSVLDEGAEIARNYGVFGNLPVTVFVNPEGKVVNIHRGPLAAEQIEAYVAEIMIP